VHFGAGIAHILSPSYNAAHQIDLVISIAATSPRIAVKMRRYGAGLCEEIRLTLHATRRKERIIEAN